MGLRVDSLADLPEQVRQQVGGKIAAQASKYHNRRMVMVYNGQAFVACVDVSAVITAHISEETPERNKR